METIKAKTKNYIRFFFQTKKEEIRAKKILLKALSKAGFEMVEARVN